jgi:HlyD family secretion protein
MPNGMRLGHPPPSLRPDRILSEPMDPPQAPPWLHRHRRLLLPLALAGAAAAAGTGLWLLLRRAPPGGIELSGRIEGYETDVGARIGGRVEEVTVREGARVRRGQLLVRIDDEELRARLRGAEARVASARQQARQTRFLVDELASRIQEAELNRAQARQDFEARVARAAADLARSEADLDQAQARLRFARVSLERQSLLQSEGATALQDLDQARTTFEAARATVDAARRQVEAARGGLELARSSSYNPSIRAAQLAALREQRRGALAQLAASEDDVRNAVAARQEVQARVADLRVAAPIDGVVIARAVEPGAVVTAGRTLLTLLDPATVYMRGFVPEGEIGRVRVGQPARVFLDSAPRQPLAARVAMVDPEASFTPENVYFRDDRVRQVFGVKLSILEPGGAAKPGMPADAVIDPPR